MIKNINIKVILITKIRNEFSEKVVERYNEQYHNLHIIYSDDFHDRYFIIDRKVVYHSGASINHAGKRIFSINKIEDKLVKDVLINNIINNTLD